MLLSSLCGKGKETALIPESPLQGDLSQQFARREICSWFQQNWSSHPYKGREEQTQMCHWVRLTLLSLNTLFSKTMLANAYGNQELNPGLSHRLTGTQRLELLPRVCSSKYQTAAPMTSFYSPDF